MHSSGVLGRASNPAQPAAKSVSHKPSAQPAAQPARKGPQEKVAANDSFEELAQLRRLLSEDDAAEDTVSVEDSSMHLVQRALQWEGQEGKYQEGRGEHSRRAE